MTKPTDHAPDAPAPPEIGDPLGDPLDAPSPEADPEAARHETPWRMTLRRFLQHRLAVWSALTLVVLYLAAIFCEFVAPYGLASYRFDRPYSPPQRLHFWSDEGLHLRPFVRPLRQMRHPRTLRAMYREDPDRRLPVRFFVRGEPYELLGLIPTDRHLFGVGGGPGEPTASEATIFLLGTDAMGRDLFTRIVHGARISLTIGLIGVGLSFVLGMTIGAVSGYYGGWVDALTQRGIEVVRAFPTIPLWMALAAALPATWPPLRTYFGITVVLSLLGWTGLARQVRGKILALREEDFAVAARLLGASPMRVMFRHLLPSFASHIIVSLTIAVPAMILGETALSFLGLGLRPPMTSWGVLLREAQNIQAVVEQPWLLTPAFFVILAVLAFNFVGDGLRDAADPHGK